MFDADKEKDDYWTEEDWRNYFDYLDDFSDYEDGVTSIGDLDFNE